MEVLEQYGELEKIGLPEVLDFKEEKPQPQAISGNDFYGNKLAAPQQQQQQQQPQQQRALTHHQSNPGTAAHPNIYPIESLSPYNHKWTIRARCTHKGDMKEWMKSSGPGKLFSVNLLDETGEIRATGFNEVAEKLFPIFQEGTVYYISAPCRVSLAKKQFSNLPNDYELQFERDTEVEKVGRLVRSCKPLSNPFPGRRPRKCTPDTIQLHEDRRAQCRRKGHHHRHHRHTQGGWRDQHNNLKDHHEGL
jgi:replication factor A1